VRGSGFGDPGPACSASGGVSLQGARTLLSKRLILGGCDSE